MAGVAATDGLNGAAAAAAAAAAAGETGTGNSNCLSLLLALTIEQQQIMARNVTILLLGRKVFLVTAIAR